MPTAGSIEIRPTRSDAEKDIDAFYKVLKSVRKFSDLTLAKIGKITKEDIDQVETNLHRRIKRKSLSEVERKLLLTHIFVDQQLIYGKARTAIAAIPDALYFAFLHHFNAVETAQDNARARLVGTYKLWRFSVEHDGEFVLGRLDVFEDEATRALKVKMLQPKRARDGLRGTVERLEGYLFRIANMYILLLADPHTNDPRMTIFPRSKADLVGTKVNPHSIFLGEQLHIVHLDGFGLGVDGSSGFFSPVHLSLVDDVRELERLEEELDVMPKNNPGIPPRVAAKLERNGPLRRL